MLDSLEKYFSLQLFSEYICIPIPWLFINVSKYSCNKAYIIIVDLHSIDFPSIDDCCRVSFNEKNCCSKKHYYVHPLQHVIRGRSNESIRYKNGKSSNPGSNFWIMAYAGLRETAVGPKSGC